MKKIFLFLLAASITATASAQTEVTGEGSNKIIKGFMSRADLANEPAFGWFTENSKGFTPDASALAAFKAQKDSIYIIAFGGTWCGDSKYLLPKFLALADAAGLSQDRITLIGVDRNKKTVQHLSETFQVDRIPTFIVMKNGQEIGRVAEYGKTGMFDRELGAIVSGKK